MMAENMTVEERMECIREVARAEPGGWAAEQLHLLVAETRLDEQLRTCEIVRCHCPHGDAYYSCPSCVTVRQKIRGLAPSAAGIEHECEKCERRCNCDGTHKRCFHCGGRLRTCSNWSSTHEPPEFGPESTPARR